MESVLLSIIVPVYNVENYLEECVNSILRQTWQSYEIILVDDGSTDASGKICDQYAVKNQKIKVIHKKNGGLSSARNAGLDAAKGKYIGFVDSDDYIMPEMYETLIAGLRESNAQIASCRYFTFDKTEDTKRKCERKKKYTYQTSDSLKHFFLRDISESVCDKVYLKELWKERRFVEGEINEDTYVVYELLKHSSNIVCFMQKMYGYRQRRGSITNSGYSAKFGVVERHLKELEKSVCMEYPELIPYVKHFLSVHYFCLLCAIAHGGESWKYEREYSFYRVRFKKIFYYFIKWNKLALKDYIVAIILISPFNMIGKRYSNDR